MKLLMLLLLAAAVTAKVRPKPPRFRTRKIGDAITVVQTSHWPKITLPPPPPPPRPGGVYAANAQSSLHFELDPEASVQPVHDPVETQMPTGSVTAAEPMFTIDPTEKFQIEGPVDEPEDDFDPDLDFDSPDLVKATATPPSKTIFPQIIVPTSTSDNAVEVHILPFHLTITEYCTIDHLNIFKTAKVRYVNGALSVNTNMGPKELRYIDHRVPNFKPLRLGYYHFDVSKMYFLYNPQGTPPKGYTWSQCGWADNETYKQCGECRAAQWSGPPVDCGLDNLGPKKWSRTKEMDCSFILGTRNTNEA